ncbi:unnamed protein product [Ambrosiozyma monospora]|uniref:Unnamed protein product n=1 Tax=Ambrosiozyma monospora TaxID=43982 RepID=A0ACB5SXQ0_AMBMO|nr:unnamed protein product [Ambrosiozyma monospora]
MIDLSDYEAYLEDDFDATKFANGILLSTNNPDDTSLDLVTPIKRLTFDLNEIDRKIEKNSNENYSELIKEFENVQKFHDTVDELKPSLQQLNLSYSRLETEILKPYNEASSLHSALKKIHQTSDLLRSSTYFIYLISKVEEVGKSDPELNAKPFKNILILAKLFNQLKSHIAGAPFLKSLKLVRDYESFQNLQISRITDVCTTHFKRLNLDNYDDTAIVNLINTLILLSPETFYNQFQQLMSTHTSSAINSILRNLNNPKNFERIFKEISKNGRLLSKLEQLMKLNKWLGPTDNANKSVSLQQRTESNKLKTTTPPTILDKLISVLEFNTNIITLYWKDIAIAIEPKFKEIIHRGGPISKNLRNVKEDIKRIVRDAVMGSFVDELKDVKTKECIEVRMMLNSVAPLDGRR